MSVEFTNGYVVSKTEWRVYYRFKYLAIGNGWNFNTIAKSKFKWNLNPVQSLCLGRAIAEAVSRWLPTAAARVESRVWSSGICGG
jgi:hypothetical protein